MNAPMSPGRLAEIRESVTRAPHPAPGTWAAGLRDLLAEVDRLQAGFAELEAAVYGDATVRRWGPVEQVWHLHAAVAAQQARAGTLNGLARGQRRRADVAEARVRVLEAELAEGRPVDEDPVAFSLTSDGEAALARLDAALAPSPAELPLACDGPTAGGLTVYLAEHDSIVMGLYTTASEARAHCVAEERRSWSMGTRLTFDWIEDEEDGVAELVTADEDCGTEDVTGYVVTTLEVASEYDPDGDE